MRRWWRKDSGQVEVETAIVLPLFVFLLLGFLQLGLIQQAKVLAKYAAFQAVRTGALKNADQEEMEKAALAAMLPMLSFKGSGDNEVLLSTRTADQWIEKWQKEGFGRNPINQMQDADNQKYVQVEICAPTKGEASGHAFTAEGKQYLPFDHPDVGSCAKVDGGGCNRDCLVGKLRIRLTVNYRMFIPFANAMLYRIWKGYKVVETFRMGDEGTEGATDAEGVYIMPLKVFYSMRLHSDVPIDTLPGNNVCEGT